MLGSVENINQFAYVVGWRMGTCWEKNIKPEKKNKKGLRTEMLKGQDRCLFILDKLTVELSPRRHPSPNRLPLLTPFFALS